MTIKWDDRVKEDSQSGVDDIEERFDIFKNHFPHLMAIDSKVTPEVIIAVDETFFMMVNADYTEVKMSRKKAAKIMRMLPDNIRQGPVTLDIIRAIDKQTRLYSSEENRKQTLKIADTKVRSYRRFTDRAFARWELGRLAEALEDFDRACELSPGDQDIFRCRIRVMIEMGMFERALQNLSIIDEEMVEITADNADIRSSIPWYYVRCGAPKKALHSMIKHILALKALTPYVTIDHPFVTYEKDGNKMDIGVIASIEGYIDLAKQIEEENKSDTEINSLLNDFKTEFLKLRNQWGV